MHGRRVLSVPVPDAATARFAGFVQVRDDARAEDLRWTVPGSATAPAPAPPRDAAPAAERAPGPVGAWDR